MGYRIAGLTDMGWVSLPCYSIIPKVMIHPYVFMAILVYTNVLDTESFQFQNLTWRKSTIDRLDRGFSDTFRLNMDIPQIARSLSGGNPFHEFASLRYHKLDQDEQTPE
jgi:hypothetical protein